MLGGVFPNLHDSAFEATSTFVHQHVEQEHGPICTANPLEAQDGESGAANPGWGSTPAAVVA